MWRGLMSQNKVWLAHYPESIEKTITLPDIAMGQILQETAAKFPTNYALSFYGRKITYDQLNKMTQSFTSSLQKNQVKKGDRVAIMLPNCPQYVISYYGILNAGAIVTQVNPMSVERELEYILKDSGAETIIVLDALYPRVKSVQPQSILKNIIVVSIQPSGQNFVPDR